MAQPKLKIGAAELQLSEDEFSVQVASPADPIFWVRVERGDAGVIVVTDFGPGARPIAELEEALAAAIAAIAPRRVEVLVFKDLVPGGGQQPAFSVKLVRNADLAKTLGTSIAASIGSSVAGFAIERRGEKLDAVLTLSGS